MAATKLRIYQDVARLLADARLSLITDDVEIRYALDDAWAEAVEFVLRQAPWRFALKTAELVASTGPLPGFAHVFVRPADWLRTHAIFQADQVGREHPLDLREQRLKISANRIATPDAETSAVQMRYVSIDFIDPALALNPWPEHFAQTVTAYLAFLVAERVTGERGAAARMSQLFSSLLPEAIAIDAVPENRWLAAQNDGSYLRSLLETLEAGYWRFAMKTDEFLAEELPTQSGTPAAGFPYRYARPVGWRKTHAAFVAYDGRECPIDLREDVGPDGEVQWSTAAESFAVRYVSSILGLNPRLWPDAFTEAVHARIRYSQGSAGNQIEGAKVEAALWQKALGDALDSASEPENRWWRFQRDGRWIDAVHYTLERGRWRFAIDTVEIAADVTDSAGTPLETPLGRGTISPGYSAHFTKPNDWLRTIWLYRGDGTVGWNGEREDIDYRDEGSAFHANFSPVQLRYLSRRGLESWRWPSLFRDAVLAWLEYGEARGDPTRTAVAAAKLKFFDDAFATARDKDDAKEQPRVTQYGRFVRARGRSIGHGGAGGGFDGTTPSSTTILTGDNGEFLTSDSGEFLTPG